MTHYINRLKGKKKTRIISMQEKPFNKNLTTFLRLKLGSHTIICGLRHFSKARLNKGRTLLPAALWDLSPHLAPPYHGVPTSVSHHQHSGTQAGKPQWFYTSCFPSPPTSNQPSGGIYFCSEVTLKSIHFLYLHFQCTSNHLQ